MQTSAIMFLQAVIQFITGDALAQGAKYLLVFPHTRSNQCVLTEMSSMP